MYCALTITLTSADAQTAAVTIYGEAISEDDIEQRAKLNLLTTHRQVWVAISALFDKDQGYLKIERLRPPNRHTRTPRR